MQSNLSIPRAQIIPELAYPDVLAATQWLSNAFGFSVRLRMGAHRAQLVFGSGAVVVREGDALQPGASPSHAVMVRVENVDEHHARALSAGARVSGPPTTHPYGERQYSAQDLAGHWWVFSQSVGDVHPSQWGGELASDRATPSSNPVTMKVHGSCHCGDVRFVAEVAPERTSICHCNDCQKLTGTAFRVSTPALPGTFSLVQGEPKVYVKVAESGSRRAQAFCPACGSPLFTYDADSPAAYGLRVGVLAERRQLCPTWQKWGDSALDWTQDLAELEQAPRNERQA